MLRSIELLVVAATAIRVLNVPRTAFATDAADGGGSGSAQATVVSRATASSSQGLPVGRCVDRCRQHCRAPKCWHRSCHCAAAPACAPAGRGLRRCRAKSVGRGRLIGSGRRLRA